MSAWSFVVLFVGGVFAVFVAAARITLRKRGLPKFSEEAPEKPGLPDVYALAKPYAAAVKAVLQMVIGITAVSVVGWNIFLGPDKDPTTLILNGIGVGLAAAAALELAYTLFTPGPDEALDPLMLALSATLLLKLAQLKDSVSLSGAVALLLLGLLLAALFATRLMLAERDEDDERPRIWWVPHRKTKREKRL